MKVYIITGCCGFIGFHLSKKLLDTGNLIIGIDNTQKEYGLNNLEELRKYPNFKFLFRHLDCVDIDSFPYDIDGVFHLAYTPRVQKSFDYMIETTHNNMVMTARVLEWCRKNKTKLVFASSSTAITCLSPYGIQKNACENLMSLYNNKMGVPTISLRYFSVVGKNMNTTDDYTLLLPKLIDCALNDKEFTLYGDGTIMRDFTHVSDVVDATILAMEKPCFGVLDVGFGQPYTVRDIIKMVEKETGKTIFIKYERERVEPSKTEALKKYETEKVLGWVPKITIQETIKEMVEERKNETNN